MYLNYMFVRNEFRVMVGVNVVNTSCISCKSSACVTYDTIESTFSTVCLVIIICGYFSMYSVTVEDFYFGVINTGCYMCLQFCSRAAYKLQVSRL